GPYLSCEKPGVHDTRQIRPPSADELAMLTAPRNGVLLVTLAPELVPQGFIAKLVAAGGRVSLGPSLASFPPTPAALADGAGGLTASFKGQAPLVQRGRGTDRAGIGTA